LGGRKPNTDSEKIVENAKELIAVSLTRTWSGERGDRAAERMPAAIRTKCAELTTRIDSKRQVALTQSQSASCDVAKHLRWRILSSSANFCPAVARRWATSSVGK
jgi:hypothetical protein